jgi:hypothetical protein
MRRPFEKIETGNLARRIEEISTYYMKEVRLAALACFKLIASRISQSSMPTRLKPSTWPRRTLKLGNPPSPLEKAFYGQIQVSTFLAHVFLFAKSLFS